MYCTRNVSDSVVWVGASDRRLALFENLFPIPRGVSYNSYLILDEKTALLDTTDASVTQTVSGKCQPQLKRQTVRLSDHQPYGARSLRQYRRASAALSAPDPCGQRQNLLPLFSQFYDLDLTGRTLTVKEGDTLCLGSHTLHFFLAPMVHWPEVMVTYEETEQILFSADAFGSFGALNGHLFADEVNFDRDWLDDARRYYCNIVGKYGIQVQAALKKLSALSIRTICPLHGPVWRENLEYLLSKYDLWSRYVPEDNAVAIFYASMYGDTENAANILAAGLAEGGIKNIALYDVSVTDVSVLIAEAFRCSHLVFAAPTYNNGVYPAMYNFLHDMGALSLQNRTIGLIENGTWGPVSAKQMQQLFSEMKQMNVLEPVVTVKSSVKEDSLAALCALKDRILASCTK